LKKIGVLRYIATGLRDFNKQPVPPSPRLNWEFYVVCSGHCAPYFPNGDSPDPETGVLWILPAHLTYGWKGSDNICERIVFHFGHVPHEVAALTVERNFLKTELSKTYIQRIREIAEELFPHFKETNRVSHLVFEKALIELSIIALNSETTKKEIPLHMATTERVERALSWYSINMSRNPTVQEVASANHLSSMHLRRLFQSDRNTTPHKAFRELQIKRAMGLLATTRHTLDEISSQCGFHNSTNFFRVFKRETNSTPHKWRRTMMVGER
jgi:AraC family transcriptional regulator